MAHTDAGSRQALTVSVASAINYYEGILDNTPCATIVLFGSTLELNG